MKLRQFICERTQIELIQSIISWTKLAD
jgi:hypothetical protein